MIKNRYPITWKEIAAKVKFEVNNRCYRCGHPHDPKKGYTLTVHHLDGNPQNNSPKNLMALCQRCHLRSQHYSKAIEIGQMNLFPPKVEQLSEYD